MAAGDIGRPTGETFAARIAALVLRLARTRFYGKVELTFEDGVVQHVTKTESLKPSSLPAVGGE